MAIDTSTMTFLNDARLVQVRMARISADRPSVSTQGGSIEFVCTFGLGGHTNNKKKATAKVVLQASGLPEVGSKTAQERDFTIEVECRGSYEWPYEVDATHFQSLDLRHIICQPVYTAALLKVRELLNSVGVGGIKLPYDIRLASKEATTVEDRAPQSVNQSASTPTKKKRRSTQ